MKLAFSNIAWNEEEEATVLSCLVATGFRGIEIAPTKCWPDWRGVTRASMAELRAKTAGAGFEIPSLQAILFGKPALKLFGADDEMPALYAHIEAVAGIAEALGAKTLVFGAPLNRDPGTLAPEAAIEIATTRLREAGSICAGHGVWLGIEANPSAYQCRFITRWAEAAHLVRRCDSAGVRLHLDAACTFLEGDSLSEAVAETQDILAHVHISEPHLGRFETPQVDHKAFAAALRRANYQGWCSVEMRRTSDPAVAIRAAADMAAALYG